MPDVNRHWLDDTGLALVWAKVKALPKGDTNVIESVTVNGITMPITSKAANIVIKKNGTSIPLTNLEVDIPVPVSTSDLTNDSDFQNSTQVTAAINAAIGQIPTIEFIVVASVSDLPNPGVAGKFYLVPNSGSGGNIYDEYIWTIVDSTTTPATYGYEKIGTTAVDLSNYVQKTDYITSAEIDAICV